MREEPLWFKISSMDKTKETLQNFILLLIDTVCVLCSYYLSGYLWLIVYKDLDRQFAIDKIRYNALIVFAAYILVTLFYSERRDYIIRGFFEELRVVVQKCIVFACVIAVCAVFWKGTMDFPRGVYVLTLFFSVILMWILRVLVKEYLKLQNTGKSTLRMFVITTKQRAENMLSEMKQFDDWTRRIEGVIITDEDMMNQTIAGVPVLANEDNMMDYICREIVDEVYIDIGTTSKKSIKPLVMALEEMGVTVHIKLDIMDMFSDFDATLGTFGDISVVTFAHRFYDYKKLVIKRVMDIIGSIVGLFIMLIVMIPVAPAIKLESKGPLFFKQRRVGKNGRYFYIYKFRSMRVDAEEQKAALMEQNEMDGLMFKMTDDPRITRVGRFIRKTSIDELPQFINVLKGEMSMVGTRPPTVEEFQLYEGHHKRRLSMKPGITGMWQAYGRDSVFNFEDVVKMDLDYIDHWSLTLDVKILLQTLLGVFRSSGK